MCSVLIIKPHLHCKKPRLMTLLF